MNLTSSNLNPLARATLAILLTSACGSPHIIGDNLDATGGASPVATGGASPVATGGAPMGGTSSVSNLATATLAQCNIPSLGVPSEQLIDIPSELTGPNWSIKASNCEQGGWDLSQCAGHTATFTSVNTGTTTGSGTLTAWVVTLGSTVCCVYESDESDPGIYPAPCENKPPTCVGSPPGNCVCLSDGTWGHCLGANPDPKVEACVNSGGTAGSALCCTSTADFPNTCSIGACGCSPENSKNITICQCPSGSCFNGTVCVTGY